MVDLYEAMSTLRAVRRLKPDPIPAEVLERVLQAAAWAPTGGNVQPFRIIAVQQPVLKAALQGWYHSEWHAYSKGHLAAMENMAEEPRLAMARMLKAGDYLAAHLDSTPVILVFCFNPDYMAITDSDLGRPSVVGGGSVYTAVQNVMLACRAEGLGCVLTTLLCLREPQVKALLGIPQGWYTCAHVPVGYPVLKGHGALRRRGLDKLVFSDVWGKGYVAGEVKLQS
jgi:nitroreductase